MGISLGFKHGLVRWWGKWRWGGGGGCFNFLHKKNNIENCPFTYWLNGRWFLQIVDGDSGNLYIQYNPLQWNLWRGDASKSVPTWQVSPRHRYISMLKYILVHRKCNLDIPISTFKCPLVTGFTVFPCSDFWSQTYQMWGWFGGGVIFLLQFMLFPTFLEKINSGNKKLNIFFVISNIYINNKNCVSFWTCCVGGRSRATELPCMVCEILP